MGFFITNVKVTFREHPEPPSMPNKSIPTRKHSRLLLTTTSMHQSTTLTITNSPITKEVDTEDHLQLETLSMRIATEEDTYHQPFTTNQLATQDTVVQHQLIARHQGGSSFQRRGIAMYKVEKPAGSVLIRKGGVREHVSVYWGFV